jgi:hypothetical protein
MKVVLKDSLIIELTGVPCSGKSYLKNSLKSKLSDMDDVLFFKDRLVFSVFCNKTIGKYINVFFQNTLLFLYSFSNVKSTISVMQLSLNAILLNVGFLNKLNLIRNLILKFGRFNYVTIHFKGKTIFFDEGISHIPFNFLVANDVELQKIVKVNDWSASKLTVLIVDLAGVDIYSRIQKRGHWKTLGLTNTEVAEFVKLNNDVLSLLALEYKKGQYAMVETIFEHNAGCNFVDDLVRKVHA